MAHGVGVFAAVQHDIMYYVVVGKIIWLDYGAEGYWRSAGVASSLAHFAYLLLARKGSKGSRAGHQSASARSSRAPSAASSRRYGMRSFRVRTPTTSLLGSTTVSARRPSAQKRV